MHDHKKSNGSSNRGGDRCDCGYCLVGGCTCADSGSHDECFCDRCGDRDNDGYEDEGN